MAPPTLTPGRPGAGLLILNEQQQQQQQHHHVQQQQHHMMQQHMNGFAGIAQGHNGIERPG